MHDFHARSATPARPRTARTMARTGAAMLIVLAGGVATLAAAPLTLRPGAHQLRPIAQVQPNRNEPEQQPRDAAEIERDAADRIRADRIRQLEERRRASEAARQQAREEGALLISPDAAPDNPADPLLNTDLDPEDEIDWVPRESVELLALLDYASRTLKINILVDDALQNQNVTLKAPIKLKVKELLPFVNAMLEVRGFVLTRHPQGFYTVSQAAEIPIVLEGPGATTRIIPTPMMRPSALEPVISATMNLAQGGGTSLRITSVDELGALVLTGGPTQLDRAEELIQRISTERADQDLHRFELNHVSADFAIERILELNGKIASAAFGGVQVPPQVQGQPGRPGTVSAGALTNLDTRLFVDRGNAVLFRGTIEEAEEVADIIGAVDVITSLIAKRYVAGSVTLEVAQAAEGLGLGSITSTEDTTSAFAPQQFNRPQGLQQLERGGTLSGSRFVVDAQNGTFTYFGTEAQHARVAALVDDFKKQAIDTGTQIRVYKLFYASAAGGGGVGGEGGAPSGGASGVADILNEIIQDPSTQLTQGRFLPGQGQGQGAVPSDADVLLPPPTGAGEDLAGGGGTRLVATSENTVIVADPDRNQLIIKAPARAHDQLERIIRQLDQPQPQVLVEVKIVSVTTNDDFEYGADVQINAGQWSWLSSFGVTAPGATIQDPLSVGANATTGGIGVTSAIIRSDFVPIAINALQNQGKARILSEPRLLVNDNQEGIVNSVRTEPFATTTQTAGNPVQTSQGGSEEAGTKLTIKPQISADQSVILDFEIELSSFDRAAQQANLSPPTQEEQYESVVTVPWDSTIIVGGFRFVEDSDSESKVPFLGDIPILGDLAFKSTLKRKSTRAIFVFITPRVISDVKGGGLQLMTEGPLAEAGLTDGAPRLRPALMPVRAARERLIDRLEAEAAPGEESASAKPAAEPISSALRR